MKTPIRRVLFTVAALLGAGAVFGMTLGAIPRSKPTPTWLASSGTPVPQDFLYAMFPVDPKVPLFDSPGGTVAGTLRRAMVNSEEELVTGAAVQVREPDGARWVSLDTLVLMPPRNADRDLFAAFVQSYKARDPHQPGRSATLDVHAESPDTSLITLRLTPDDNHYERYVYRIVRGRRTPLEMYKVFGPGQALNDMDRPLLAMLAAGGFLCVLAVGVAARKRTLPRP